MTKQERIAEALRKSALMGDVYVPKDVAMDMAAVVMMGDFEDDESPTAYAIRSIGDHFADVAEARGWRPSDAEGKS